MIDLTDPLSDHLAQILEVLAVYAASNPLATNDDLIAVSAGGGEFVLDYCCPGVAWVRPITTYPTTNFPNPIPGEIRCPPPGWAATIELGIARCVTALPDSAGNLPEPEAVAHDASVANYDRSAIIQAAICGIAPLYDSQVALDQWTPLETQGGCMGSTMNVTIPYCYPCDPELDDEEFSGFGLSPFGTSEFGGTS